MNRIYIILYDLKEDSVVKERIKALGSWMNYFPKCWVIESSLSAHDIYDKIAVDYEKERFLIMELNKNNYWGVLPKEAWNWLGSK